jgi:pyruvate formate lyase activating enzyme
MSPPIRGFIENTLLDWEGKLAAVIFLPGCNFRCGYCHARHLVEPAPSDETIPLGPIVANLRRQRGWVDGVVITGGEPTLHVDLLELIELFQSEGVGVKLDTNGTRPEVLEEFLGLGVLDYVAMDVKAPLDDTYSQVAGVPVDLEAIRRSIDLLISGDVPYEFRATVCPDRTGPKEVEGIALAVRGASALYLQTFRPVNCLDRSLESLKPYNQDQMREFCALAAKYVRRCAVRGDQASELVTTG